MLDKRSKRSFIPHQRKIKELFVPHQRKDKHYNILNKPGDNPVAVLIKIADFLYAQLQCITKNDSNFHVILLCIMIFCCLSEQPYRMFFRVKFYAADPLSLHKNSKYVMALYMYIMIYNES